MLILIHTGILEFSKLDIDNYNLKYGIIIERVRFLVNSKRLLSVLKFVEINRPSKVSWRPKAAKYLKKM